MTLPRSLAAALLCLSLASCGWNTRQPPTTQLDGKAAKAPQTQVIVRDDLTTGKLVFYGPPVLDPAAPDIARDAHRLRSELDKSTGTVIHWVDLRVHWTGSGIDYWVAAEAQVSRRQGKGDNRPERPQSAPTPLKLGVPHLSVGTCARVMWIGCDHDEEITAQVPDGLLRETGPDDLRVRFSMNHGRTYEALVSSEQILLQLDRIARWQRHGG